MFFAFVEALDYWLNDFSEGRRIEPLSEEFRPLRNLSLVENELMLLYVALKY